MSTFSVPTKGMVELEPPIPKVLDRSIETDEVRVNPILAIGLFMLVFSLLFEDAAPGAVEPSTLAGAFFLVTTLTQAKVCFRKPTFAIGAFMMFTFVAVLGGLLLIVSNTDEMVKRCFQTVYLVVMAWVLSNILRVPKMMTLVAASLGTAAVLLAVLQVTGVAGNKWGDGTAVRITAFGFHPNQLALNFTLGVAALLGLSGFEHSRRYFKPVVIWPLIGIISYAIVQTGSRGGLIALAIGLLAFCAQPGNARQRVTTLFFTILGAGMVTFMVLSNPSTMARIDSTVDKGNVAGRDIVYPIAIDMIEERPIFGWGMMENTYELGNRRQEPGIANKDTHNLWLYVLTATGIVGFVPFMAGLISALLRSWRARNSILGVLPFTLMACTMAAAVGLTLMQTKVFWLVIAIAAASGTYPLIRHKPSEWSLEE